MSPRVMRFGDSGTFLAHVGPFLLEREALHNLIYGIGAEADSHPDAYLAAVERGGAVVLAAVRTPPHNLLLSRAADADALEALARDLQRHGHTPPGVHAPRQEAADFAALWAGIGGCRPRARMAQQVHQLTAVAPPSRVAGSLRAATAADLPLLERWANAFAQEALAGEPFDGRAWAVRRLGDPECSVSLWQVDGEAVSMASRTPATPGGARIGGVYTPPERRGRGYAGACVAALNEQLLAGGSRHTFLFSDLANLAAPRLYRRIGYRPMGNLNVHSFTYGSYQEER